MPDDTDKAPGELQLATEAHVKYIQSLNSRQDEYEYWLTEHLRLNGLYWGLASLFFVNRPDALPRDETIEYVLSCQCENGGFGAAPGHDAHMLYTVSAVQILAMIDALDELDARGKGREAVAACLSLVAPIQLHTVHPANSSSQSLPISRTALRARLRATNGARRTPASCTAP